MRDWGRLRRGGHFEYRTRTRTVPGMPTGTYSYRPVQYYYSTHSGYPYCTISTSYEYCFSSSIISIFPFSFFLVSPFPVVSGIPLTVLRNSPTVS